VMTLDSAPGPRGDARGSESTLEVLQALESMKGPWTGREAFCAELEGKGLSKMLGQWLAMNLESRPEGWVFRLSLPRIHALLEDYFEVDLWPVVEAAAQSKQGPKLHLVIGARSLVYAQEDRVRAQALEHESEGQVTVDVLSAGHWVHVDDPQGLSEALITRLSPSPLAGRGSG
jgi:esterase